MTATLESPHRIQPRVTADADGAFVCANCDFAIAGRPTFHIGLAFCCAGCAAGGPCRCSYDEPADDRAAAQPHECLDVTAGTGEARPAPETEPVRR